MVEVEAEVGEVGEAVEGEAVGVEAEAAEGVMMEAKVSATLKIVGKLKFRKSSLLYRHLCSVAAPPG